MNLSGQRILVVGSAGAQGSGLQPAAVDAGAVPVRVTTQAERAEQWRAGGHEAAVADLTDPAGMAAVLREHRIDAVAGILPLALGGPDRVAAGVRTYLSISGAGVPVTVNVGAPLPPPGAPDVTGSRATADALAGAGAAVLTPTGYLENHAAPWALRSIAEGELIYPRPGGDPVAWIAAADMGRAQIAALAHGVAGEVLALSGPDALTFDDLAAQLGSGLGASLVFRRVPAAEYAAATRPYIGEHAAAGVEAFYGSLPDTPNPPMTPREAPANWDRLGLRPITGSSWAAEVLRPALDAFRGAGARS